MALNMASKFLWRRQGSGNSSTTDTPNVEDVLNSYADQAGSATGPLASLLSNRASCSVSLLY